MSPITITLDPQVKKLRDQAKKQRDEREAAAEAVRVRTAELATMEDAKKLQQAKDDAEKARTKAKADFDAARKAVIDADERYDTATEELVGLRTSRSVFQTILDIATPATGVLAAAGVATADPRVNAVGSKIKEKIDALDKAIGAKVTEVKKLNETLQATRDRERKAEQAWQQAEEALLRAGQSERERIEADSQKVHWEKIVSDTEKTLKQTEKDLTDLISQKTRAERFPAEIPAYLRVSVGSGPVEPAAERVLRTLRAKNAAFQPHEFVKDLNALARKYGINGHLVSILDQLNRSKDKAVKRRILADTYAYTLLRLLEKIIKDAPAGRERSELQEAVEDRTALVNRVRDFQRDGLDKVEAPQKMFAQALLQEVADSKHTKLPTDPAALDELMARVISTL